VLLNLIGNAIKFTDSGRVVVRVEMEDQNESAIQVRFSVSDTGFGIAAEKQHLLFLPFSQVDSSITRKFGGTGLGLAISKRLVELMDGSIGVNSEQEKGSTFWFSLPFPSSIDPALEKQQLQQSIAALSAEFASQRILVVEDNAVLRDLLLRQLMFLGLDAAAVGSAAEAVQKVQTKEFAIVLMDVHLPDMSGNQATEAIRKWEQSSGTTPCVIIAVTAGAMEGDRDQALRAGMNDYMAKPVNMLELRDKLAGWISRRLTEQQAWSDKR
jgi:CheY-like chemotaxis protein